MAEDRNNIDKDETKINSENNQSMGNPSNSNQSNDDEYEKIKSIAEEILRCFFYQIYDKKGSVILFLCLDVI